MPSSPANDIGSASVADGFRMTSLVDLVQSITSLGYGFTVPTPLTHQRVLTRENIPKIITLRDVFGWNLSFSEDDIASYILNLMEKAGVLLRSEERLRSDVRIASIDNDVFLHSSFPTIEETAVFFGPDTYRFARFIRQALNLEQGLKNAQPLVDYARPRKILDIGCGSGAGGIVAARHLKASGITPDVTLSDINPLALRYARANAEVAGIPVKAVESDVFANISGQFDLILSNPPYLDDASERTYRHGGARLGRALSLRIAEESLHQLASGGMLVLYTGVAIVHGIDPFLAELKPLLANIDCKWSYEEIDPDVFGEELERHIYAHVDRIAAVGLMVRRVERIN